ncbi:MAG: long-chain fatty acid--CoA ligase [Candidatus Binatia bacterium]
MLSEVREFIAAPDADRFDALAIGVFRFQYEGNEPYRRFCDSRRRTPRTVAHWSEIPAVPVSAFKESALGVAGLPDGALFLTSGTTRGIEGRGRHRVPDPSIYRDSALAHFRRCVLPDRASPRFLVLAPPLAEEPHSSLSQMIEWLAEELGVGGAEHFVSRGEVRSTELIERLRELESTREPLLLIGVTYAFVRFYDFCQAQGIRFRLPYGSRIVDTGGTKGRSRSMSRNGLLRAFWQCFGVPGYYVANEYGMTEMCSQFYDDSIRNHIDGRKRDRSKSAPAWVRTQVVSPETLEPVPRGTRGLLRHFDLANVGSVSALQTEDLGVEIGEGFEVLGRAEGAEARGCALLIEPAVVE